MEQEKKKNLLSRLSFWQWVCCGLVLAILVALIGSLFRDRSNGETQTEETPKRIVAIDEADWESTTEVNGSVIEVSAKTLEDGLQDMGILITQEYFFTEVINYAKKDDFLWLFDATSIAMLSYEGKIGAGIDFGQIKISMANGNSAVTVNMPKAEIRYTDLDQNSLTVYTEKNGLGNKLGLEDFNKAQADLKEAATAKAIERGVLEKAEENAQMLIRNFIAGMLGNSVTVTFMITA